MKNHNKVLKMVLAAFFLALSYVLPFLTGQIPEIGQMLCPLHIPVLLCGFFCGWPWGLAVGFIAPLLRSSMLGMPPMPTAIPMAFELATYGAISGMMHQLLPRKKPYIYCSLLTAMLAGRIVWGIVSYIYLGLNGGAFTISTFIAGAFTGAIPGIILQIVLIPILVMALERQKIFKK